MRQQVASADQVNAEVAARQHGIVAYAQLLAAGLKPPAVHRRAAAGRLHRVYRGVYAVGHRALSNEGRWFAAVAACGLGTVLSHRSAAELWRLLPVSAGPVHVTVPGSGGRARRPGLLIHHSSSMLPTDVTRRDGIEVTRPGRTIADLRRTEPAQSLREAAFRRLD